MIKSSKLIVIILHIFFMYSCNSNAQTATISATEFEKGINLSDVQILDVRTAEEYNSGHLANALQANWNNEKEFQERVKALDKTKPIYIYCLGGGRSNEAMQCLKKNGYGTIYNMKGGINAWKQENKKVEGIEKVYQIKLAEYLSSIPKDKTVLVDIGAKWCPPCKKMQPIIDELEKENYTIIKIDGGSQSELCKQLNATTFPTFILYKKGKETKRKQGLLTKEELINLLNN